MTSTSGFKHLGRDCPICNGNYHRHDCRESLSTGFVFCRDTTANPGGQWRYLRDDANGCPVWAWGEGASADRPLRVTFKPAAPAVPALPVPQRDSAYRKIAACGLSQTHRAEIAERPQVTLDELQRLVDARHLFTWRGGEPVSGARWGIPGVDHGGQLVPGVYTWAIAVPNPQCQVAGVQLRNPKGGYYWASSAKHDGPGPNLDNGELPLGVYGSEAPGGVVEVAEGYFKPALSQARYGGAWIGMAGGQWAKAPEQMRAALDARICTSVVLNADGGAIANPLVMRAYSDLAALLESWGMPLSVRWWGQATKADGDIDEISLDTYQAAQLLTWAEFAALSTVPPAAAQPKSSKRGFKIPEAQQLTQATHTVNTRWVSDAMAGIDLSGSKIIAVASAPNTGKTTWLETFLKPYQNDENPVWIFTYRVSLETTNGTRFNLPTRAEMPQYRDTIGASGATFCIHSTRENCMSGFNGATAPVGVVVLDEVRGVLNDLVHSGLVKRGQVIPHLAKFLKRCVAAGYPIVSLDAHLSDHELNAIAQLVGATTDQITCVQNTYQPWSGRKVYPGTCLETFKRLRDHLKNGAGPCLVTTSSQTPKSKYGSIALEQEALSHGKRVLRVDAETIKQVDHPAAKFKVLLEGGDKELINTFIRAFEVVILSPVIESGFSLEIFGFYKGQFSFMAGNLAPENGVQQLLRLRDKDVPLYLGEPNNRRGLPPALKRGNGSDDPRILLDGELNRAKANLHQLLAPSDNGGSIDPVFVDYWAKSAARDNASINHYSDLVLAYLKRMGCSVEAAPDVGDTKPLAEELRYSSLARAELRSGEVGRANDITDKEADQLKEKPFHTTDDQRQLAKHALAKRYRAPVQPGLALLDMLCPDFRGQAQLLFYLTLGRDQLKAHDQAALDNLAADGPTFIPDVSRKLIGYRIHALERLGIADLISRAGDTLTNTDEAIDKIGHLLKHCQADIARVLGIEFNDQWDTIRRVNHICETFLGQPLLKATGATTGRRDQKRQKVYEVRSLIPSELTLDADQALQNLTLPLAGWLGEKGGKDLLPEVTAALQNAYLPYLLGHWQEALPAEVETVSLATV